MIGKKCAGCHEIKPFKKFYSSVVTRDRFTKCCHDCLVNFFDMRASSNRPPNKAEQAVLRGKKACSDCGEVKKLSEFHKHMKSPDGHQVYCKPCQIIKNKQSKVKTDLMKK